MMNVRKNAKYAVACLSSMGLRITPENRMAVHNSNRFLLQATSAETNVLNVTSALGPTCLVMTRFVAGSPMAAFIKAQLRVASGERVKAEKAGLQNIAILKTGVTL